MANIQKAMVFDYVVVGGGSAGCVLANRLSEERDVTVCLLEAGPPDRHPLIHMPMGIIWMMRSKTLNWNFYTEGEPEMGGRRMFWPRGRTLGGSSSSNAMCYLRGHPADYDEWAALGNPGWSFADVLPYFKRSENQERGASPYHGTGGPLNVADLRSPNRLTDVFIDAGLEAGLAFNKDFNGESPEGVGPFQVTQKGGRRCSTARGYLKPVRSRPNLTVITDAYATRILFEGKRAVGLRIVAAKAATLASPCTTSPRRNSKRRVWRSSSTWASTDVPITAPPRNCVDRSTVTAVPASISPNPRDAANSAMSMNPSRAPPCM